VSALAATRLWREGRGGSGAGLGFSAHAAYEGRCGRDCFITVVYEASDSTTVTMQVNSFDRQQSRSLFSVQVTNTIVCVLQRKILVHLGVCPI
jgi:hypothetical protein